MDRNFAWCGGLESGAHFVVSLSSVVALLTTFCSRENWCFAAPVQCKCRCADAAVGSFALRGNASSSKLSPLTLIVLHQPRGAFRHQSVLSLKKGGKKERQGHAQTPWLEGSLRSIKPTCPQGRVSCVSMWWGSEDVAVWRMREVHFIPFL